MMKNRSIVLIAATMCLWACLIFILGINKHVEWEFIFVGTIGPVFVATFLLIFAKYTHVRRTTSPRFPWKTFWVIFSICVVYGIYEVSQAGWEMIDFIPLVFVMIFALYMLWLQKKKQAKNKGI